MSLNRLADEVNRFDSSEPIQNARTPPSSWYLDSDFFQLEMDAVFGRSWQYVGHRVELNEKGQYLTTQMGLNPVVAVHDGNDVRVMHNVCRHHAACVMEGKGTCETLVCPYHGWTYKLDGTLKRAPRIAGMSGVSRQNLSLPALSRGDFGPLVFAHPDANESSSQWENKMASLIGQFDDFGWKNLQFVCSRTYSLKCNWKVFVDNYLDGGYHVSLLHKGLAGQLELSGYENQSGEGYTVQTCKGVSTAEGDTVSAKDQSEGQDFQARIGEGAIYAWLYPNMMINRYGGMMDTNLVVPTAPDQCEVHYSYFANSDIAGNTKLLEDSLSASHQVQLEDTHICESVQRGMQSIAYDSGFYAPQLEGGAHLFHCWLQKDLLGGLARS